MSARSPRALFRSPRATLRGYLSENEPWCSWYGRPVSSDGVTGPADSTHKGLDRVEGRRPGEWVAHSTVREVYSSWWMSLRIDDVERPDGSRTDHEVVRGPDAAGMVLLNPDRGILMIWRHRFLPDTWGWEIPGGKIDPGETPELAARREALEETGWRASGPVVLLNRHHPSVGLVNQTFSLFLADDATYEGPPSDVNEAVRVEWRSFADVVSDISSGEITDGFTLLGVVLAMAVTNRGDLRSAWVSEGAAAGDDSSEGSPDDQEIVQQ